MKDETRVAQINLRLTPSELEELDELARDLSLDRSSTLRFLVRKECRSLANKQRRAAGS